MSAFPYNGDNGYTLPRVVVLGLASCYGCQLQITNNEAHLLEILGQFDLRYWQLVSSEAMPSDFDVAIIEGAVTTESARVLVRKVRERAKVVIAIGSCAIGAGVLGLAAKEYEGRVFEVYDKIPAICSDAIAPRSVTAEIPVDYEVCGCPIETSEFLSILNKALYGSNRNETGETLCGECKRNENTCLFEEKKLCLGLVTRAGCKARCINLGRACLGCRGISDDANLSSAHEVVKRYGFSPEEFDQALELFNQASKQN